MAMNFLQPRETSKSGNENLNAQANQTAQNTTAMQTTQAGDPLAKVDASTATVDTADRGVASIINEFQSTPRVSAQDDLEGQTQQLTLPQATTPDNAQGIFSRVDAILQESDTVRDREGLQESDTALQQAIAQSIGNLSQRGAVTEQLQQELGIGQKSQELADIQNTIRSKSKSYRDRIERTRNNGALTQRQQEARVAEIERKGASELADLSIIEQAKQNNLTTARDLVKDKVELRFADEETKLEGLQFFFNNNRDLLDKATEEEIQQNILRQQTKLGIAKDQYSRLENTKLEIMTQATQNGAPNAVLQSIQEAETPAEARSAAGEFAVDMTERLQQQRLRQQINAANQPSGVKLQTFQQDGVTYTFNPVTGETQRAVDGEDQTLEEVAQREANERKVLQDIERVNEMLSNEVGLKSSSGALRSSFLTNLSTLEGGQGDAINQKNDFLAQASYIVNNLTFEKLQDLKAGGATFGALSDSELRAIGSASNELAGMAIEDEAGNIQGFRGSEEKVRDNLRRIQENYTRALDKANAEVLDDETFQEIVNTQ